MVLYRKYRPTSFKEVTGQEHIVTTLKNAVAGNLLSHAYLFSGPRGSGKTSLARILAKAANCQKPKDGEPCNVCTSCKEIAAGKAIDLVEIDAASNRGIDEMRQLREGVAFSPVSLKYKVFVIDESHQLTKEAANALLKTLEEPPAHALFILATTEAHKMIPTIASRCQRFDFRKLTVPEISVKLAEITKAEGVQIDKEAIQLIAQNAGGSLRDALSILDKVLTFHTLSKAKETIAKETIKDLLGLVDVNLVGEFVQFLVEKKASEAIDFLNRNLAQGMDPQEFAKNTVRYLRYTLVLHINPDLTSILESELTPEQTSRMQEQAKQFDGTNLPAIVESFMKAEQEMKYASIVQLPLELAIVESTISPHAT